jgi:hypothetical protein
MSDASAETRFYRALVAIETDATRYYGADATRPKRLTKADAEQMLAHLAADLKALLPAISGCSLIAPGVIYDQTQILRPGFPVFRALEAVSVNRSTERFRPGLVSVGTQGGKMPVSGLEPFRDIPLGLLQLLPVVIQGPGGLVDELGQAMEYRFLEEGQLSAHSAAWLETAFGVSINHARLMTLTDLSAMLRMQLDHFGFLPLWELLDAALDERGDPLTVTATGGVSFEWRGESVHTTFESFDHWAREGGGSAVSAERQALAAGYGEWTREVRQYSTTLRAHGVDLRFHHPDDLRELDESYLVEDTAIEAPPGAAVLTEHSFEDLGTVAVTAVESGRIRNYYPLRPQGLNDLHAALRSRVPGGQTVAFPGTILHDTGSRRLIPDSDTAT